MLIASLTFDHEPMQWAQLPSVMLLWVQNAGGLATFGILLWLLTRLLEKVPILILPTTVSVRQRGLLTNLFVGGALIACAGYLPLVIVWLSILLGLPIWPSWFPRRQPQEDLTAGDYGMLIGGASALTVVVAPILWNTCTRFRFGRIWAIALLSLKEAIRGRVIWIFGLMALVFLFADWFVTYKAEDQVRNYVRVVYWSMTPLFLATAALLGSFSIPTDVKNYAIHTVVTKPVEKFEIVLGRFLGHGILLTAGLFVVSCLSLGYVIRGVNEEAKQESYKARDVVYGQMQFAGTKNAQTADKVGREWGYRWYITAPPKNKPNAFRQYALWDFADVGAEIGQRSEPVHFEYSFDIFRLSKGKQGEGVHCTFTFADGTRRPDELEAISYKREQEWNLKVTAANKILDKAQREEAKENIKYELLKKYRIYQVFESVKDYHTQAIDIPARVFQVLLAETEAPPDRGAPSPRLRVFVNVDTDDAPQMLGVAKQDFYLVAEVKPFWQNFLKGIIGLWCTLMVVLGVAIACSTYLSGVISLLCTLFLYGSGLCTDYLREVALQQTDGGGPSQSIIRLTMQMPIARKLDDSPTKTLVDSMDSFFSWCVGRFMNLVPDLSRHDLHQYVANGFDIGWINVLFLDNFVPLCGYLLPWAVLAYYFMKYREIGDPS